MAWNKFNLIVMLQILGIAGVGLLAGLSLRQEFLRVTSAGLILLWVGQILYLNVYMNRIHRDVYKFMEALKHQDTAQLFNRRKQGSYFSKLYASFNEITRNFRLVSIQKEAESQFFREIIKQAASGLMALREDGSIALINQAALDLLGLEEAQNQENLQKTHPTLAALLDEDGPQEEQLNLRVRGRQIQLAVKSCEIKLQGRSYRICSLLDISRELLQRELEAWQKLIRVLNHEITNSVTPIHILSTSLQDLLLPEGETVSSDRLDAGTIGRLRLGLKTLSKRSQGLADFLKTYTSFTETGDPVYTRFGMEDLLKRVCSLLASEIDQSNAEIRMEISPPDLSILADEKLIEQTLINLVKNALHATREIPGALIQLKAFSEGERVHLEVTDHGKGIPEEIKDHIFTPFFTTRKGGSGIGLSLARQIMQMHRGSIQVQAQPGLPTTFSLSF